MLYIYLDLYKAHDKRPNNQIVYPYLFFWTHLFVTNSPIIENIFIKGEVYSMPSHN